MVVNYSSTLSRRDFHAHGDRVLYSGIKARQNCPVRKPLCLKTLLTLPFANHRVLMQGCFSASNGNPVTRYFATHQCHATRIG
jgi:hypothetical protein